MNVSPHRKS
jgi:hypothetical protein